jgi:CheY-like chemotaxis protein
MARILVVDDNEEFRASIKDLLETNGYDVVLAVDGEDAIRLFEQQGCDLVVCDVFMPKKDGLETITEILRISPATPVISTTGYVASTSGRQEDLDVNYLNAAQEFGATHTLVKPFDPDEFVALIRRCLESQA